MGENTTRRSYRTVTLLEKDVCVNGHDITDKDKMVRINTNKRTGKVTYYCRACQAYAVARHYGSEYRGIYATPKKPVTLEDTLRNKIAERIEMASEDNLLEVMLLLNKIVPITEEEN